MNIYDYIIYGGGPTGLTLAYLLGRNKKKVLLVEKENKLGGCWKVDWIDNKYFSEHSPRVLTYNHMFMTLLKKINFDYKNKTVNTYGNIFQTNYKIFSFFFKNTSFSDKIKFMRSRILGVKKQTVSEWMDENNISTEGQKALTIFSIVVANSPDKLLMSEILNEGSGLLMFYQFKNNEEWIELMEKELISNNVDIIKNATLLNFTNENNIIKSAIITQNNNNITINGNIHLLTFPPLAFQKLLQNNEILQNNWMPYVDFNKWVEESYYISFGFQIHFKYEPEDIKNKPWCWSCMDDYNLIILPTYKYLTEFTKDPTILAVWSCTIVDTSRKVNGIAINDMTSDMIIDDILKKLNINSDNVIITLSEGLIRENNRWISRDSAFSVGKSGILKPKGNIENIYTIGPHNKTGITVIGKAVETAVDFIKTQKLETFGINYYINFMPYVILLIIICLILLKISY